MAKTDPLKEIYPTWLYIEPVASKQLMSAFDAIGGREALREHHSRIFEKYIDKHFNAWDCLAYYCNNDFGYSPVIFCLYAEQNEIKPNYPIRVMRQVLNLLTNPRTCKAG